MPNWCENRLFVEGEQEELKRFKETAQGKTRYGEETILNEEKFIPYPEKFRKLDVKKSELEAEYNQKRKDDEVEKMSDEEEKRWSEKNPYPKMKDGFNSGGYHWCCENWGTKWGFCNPVLEDEFEDRLEYRFDTAWSPPIPLVRKMGEMFPKLKFTLRYEEPGMNFEGRFVMDGGGESEDVCREML